MLHTRADKSKILGYSDLDQTIIIHVDNFVQMHVSCHTTDVRIFVSMLIVETENQLYTFLCPVTLKVPRIIPKSVGFISDTSPPRIL